MEPDHIEWEAPEFTYHEKDADWYWILGIVAVVGAVISIVLGNTLFAIFILLAAFVVGLFASKKPEQLNCRIDPRGIQVNEVFYPHRIMQSFWVSDDNPEDPKLLVSPKKTVAVRVVIPLIDVDPEDVRDYLIDFLDEEEQGESVVEHLMHVFRF